MEKRAHTHSRSRINRGVLVLVAVLYGHGAVAESDPEEFISGIAAVPLAASAAHSRNSYYLEVLVNEQPSGLILSCTRRGDAWWTPAQQLLALGLRTDDLQPDPEGRVDLGAISGLSYRYDAARQRLHLTVLNTRRELHVLRREPQSRDGDSAAGALINYDAIVEQLLGESTFRAYTEQRGFGDWGVISNRGTYTTAAGEGHYLRLETQWFHADPGTLRSVSAGDFINRSLTWSRSARLAGMQLRRNFALRPDLVTHPIAEFSGEVAVPSTVEVYVNQVRQLTGAVPPGPFRIETPPAINGAGQATLVVRDPLGRESVQTLDLYVVPQLLARGLRDYSIEAGVLRENFGQSSNEYRGGLVGSASIRYGFSDEVTLESHAEGANGLLQLGAGAMLQVGRFGQLNASLSLSDADGAGDKFGVGYHYVSPRFSVTADVQQADAHYRDLPALLGDLPPRRQARVFIGARLSPIIHLSASYLVADIRGNRRQIGDPLVGDGANAAVSTTRLVSLGYRQNLGRRASMSASAFRDLERGDSGGIYVGYSTAIGRSAHFQSDYASEDGRSGVTFARRSPYEGGWDATLRASHADHSHFQGGTRYTGEVGAVSLDMASEGGRQRWQLGGHGALVFAGDALIAGRYVQDEFAMVSTNGLADIPVLHENRPVGRTNADGYLLLSNVNAYQDNLVSIDPLSIPFGYRLDHPERSATPKLSAGTVVSFPIEEPGGAVLTLVDEAGEPLEVGSRGVDLDRGTPFVVGYDGTVYLTGVRDANRLRVRTGAGTCEAQFSRNRDASVQPDLGRITCR